MALSNYLEAVLLDHSLGTASFTMPATVYLTLSTADPTEDGSGLAEPAGMSRQAAAFGAAVTDAQDETWAENSAEIVLSGFTGQGTATHGAIMDAATGGNMLYYGPLAQPRPFDTGGDEIVFDAGTLRVRLD